MIGQPRSYLSKTKLPFSTRDNRFATQIIFAARDSTKVAMFNPVAAYAEPPMLLHYLWIAAKSADTPAIPVLQ